ncbi:hypothetical protein DFR70_101831 [Nocardia tenerifensis]|uniref:Nitroreductase family protein n=1 Tax=Nocardia tenerifensis TaxID=228006 RepID=A0A318KAP6_9NOCA|nr:hypothetical protein [Nocardia tenerifensis]PXX71408.1 hypothetical protein DFR70_101831 [Nocardia tenerifensis]
MTTREAPTAPDHATVLAAMRLACRAPSVHNSQPWRWEFDGARLDLYGDTDRHLLATDPLGRQMVISCGAVLHHARTAFAAAGWHTDTVRLPDPANPQHLAAITFRPWPDPPPGILARTGAIHRRYTDRLPMREPTGWTDLVHALRKLVSPHDIELDVLGEAAREKLATASERAAALRRYDMQYQAELHWWAGHSDMTEGIPPTSMVSDAEFARVGVGRAFPSVHHSDRRGETADRARLVLLSSTGESAPQWLRTGEALSAVLLECTAARLSTCALTHITELPSGRALLTGLLPHAAVPQVLLRIGAAPDDIEPPRTPRRPLTDVFIEHRK